MRRVGGVRLGGGLRVRRRPWRAVDVAVLDLETTGLDPAYDAIVSFGVVPVTAGEVRLDRAVYEVLDPGRPVPPAVVAIRSMLSFVYPTSATRSRAAVRIARRDDSLRRLGSGPSFVDTRSA